MAKSPAGKPGPRMRKWTGMGPTLRINADDFGHDPASTEAILQAVEEGLVNSLSVMAGCDEADIRRLKDVADKRPGLRIGVHLAIVDALPVHAATPIYSPASALPPDFAAFLLWYARGKIKPRQVYREWKAQIERVAAWVGGTARLNHLDSHQHLHVLPGLWKEALRLQGEFSIPQLRLPHESLPQSIGHQFPFGFLFQARTGWLAVRRGLGRNTMHSRTGGSGPAKESFLGFFRSTRFEFEFYRRRIYEHLQSHEYCELMVHPVRELTELRALKFWLDHLPGHGGGAASAIGR